MSSRLALATNMRSLREARGLSQEALADLAGIDRTYVSALERQRYAASVDTLDKLANALKVRPVELLIDPGGKPG